MQQHPLSYSDSQHFVESTLLPLDPDPGIETEKLPVVPTASTNTTLMPGIAISEEVLRGGVDSVLETLLPKETQSIFAHSYQLGPQRTMQLLGERIQNLLVFENLTKLEIGHILYWMKTEKSWEQLPGGSAFRSFREWAECNHFPLPWKDIDEYIKFYDLFCKCVDSHIPPDPLLAAVKVTPYKHGLVTQQMKGMDRQVDDLKQQWGPESPKVTTAIKQLRGALTKEIKRIIETSDKELQDQENERHYKPDEEALPILPIVSQIHLQRETIVWDSASIPLTREAFQAWKEGHVTRHFYVRGLPDAMDMKQLEEYLEENDLFIEIPVVDSEDAIIL